MDKTALTQIGLSNNEAEVYLLLLELEEALASQIAEKSRISRPHIYDTLAKLIEKGLASYVVKNNRKYFRTASPARLMDFLKEKESDLTALMPHLLELAKPKIKKPSVEMYEGKEGLKTILSDIIRSKPKEWLDFTSGRTIVLLPYFMDHWEKARAKAGIKARILINNTPIGRKRAKKLKKFKLTRVKYLPKGLESPSHIYVYGDKIVITLWTKEYPFAVLVKNKETAARFKEFFEWFWRLKKK